ncbi:Lrp/AsnC family transcriptional regulator [Candidatus Woesearchaeota archaeon]|nr:Lrp/AsnC family transcriptional regulator [Candidatus Woesearchaeota archaeon]
MKRDNKRLLILKHLRNNARSSFSNISRYTGIPVTTVFDNYHKFVKSRIITRHTSLVDFKKLGYYFRSFVFIKSRQKLELLSFLTGHDNVNSVYRISYYDYFVDAVFPTIKEFYLFLDDMRDFGILRLEIHDVIEHIKKEEFFSTGDKQKKLFRRNH